VLADIKKRNQTATKKETVDQTAHLWKAKLPELKSGFHSIKVIAKDSKGRLFRSSKTFFINK